MGTDPLAPPTRDSRALGIFLEHFGVRAPPDSPSRLEQVARAFSRIPYENLTKIVKHAECGGVEASRRLPEEVLRDHVAFGAGGTCFSLTAALLHVLRALGYEAQPILADRPYGKDTHCALRILLNGEPHLLDPGFLVLQPVRLGKPARVATAFNEVVLEPDGSGEKIGLSTIQQGNRTHRLTFKASPVDAGEFLRAWDASFDWDMMRYPLLTLLTEGSQLYLQDARFQVRSHDSVERRFLDNVELPQLVESRFGLSSEITRRALEVLRGQGETHGRAARP